ASLNRGEQVARNARNPCTGRDDLCDATSEHRIDCFVGTPPSVQLDEYGSRNANRCVVCVGASHCCPHPFVAHGIGMWASERRGGLAVKD
ncbi:MAG TPA: hypothetical protein PLV68_19770, partial [Ilumatobacteraceae bacterium]|nr:hypothetical protein [Ilumatobacteraceae bacterium]